MSSKQSTAIEERKSAWADIKFRLQYAQQKVPFKTFEAYFMKGKEPNLWPLDEDPIPLVYRLWFSADQSVEAWVAITERLLAGPQAWKTTASIEPTGDGESWKELCKAHMWGWQIDQSLKASREILEQHAAARHYDGGQPYDGSDVIPPPGFMGGLEKKLYLFLTGQAPGSEGLSYKGKKLFEPSTYFSHIYYYEATRWLDGSTPTNPYCLYNYMGRHWFNSMTADYMPDIERNPGIQAYLDCYLRLVARYPESGVDEERATYCKEIRQLLNGGDLLEPLKTMWTNAKINKERIDLNAYMNEEPFYIGEF